MGRKSNAQKAAEAAATPTAPVADTGSDFDALNAPVAEPVAEEPDAEPETAEEPTAEPVAEEPAVEDAPPAAEGDNDTPVVAVCKIDGIYKAGTIFTPKTAAKLAELRGMNAVRDLNDRERAALGLTDD